MIDFTQKGTKLPIIPKGTEYKVQDGGICNKIYNHIDFVSFGMVDDIWLKCESSNYISKTNHYLIKLSTIERLAKEQGMYNPNNEQMKTQVTLNAYGGVVVTENNTTTIHSKETTLQIYEVVKADLEKPRLRKINTWYGLKEFPNYMCFTPDNFHFYGINNEGNWFDLRSDGYKMLSETNYELSTETVETALKREAIKRGFLKDGVRYVKDGETQIWTKSGNLELEYNYKTNELKLWSDKSENKEDGYVDNARVYGIIFRKGTWATIIKPETISIEEAEKRTGCKIV